MVSGAFAPNVFKCAVLDVRWFLVSAGVAEFSTWFLFYHTPIGNFSRFVFLFFLSATLAVLVR